MMIKVVFLFANEMLMIFMVARRGAHLAAERGGVERRQWSEAERSGAKWRGRGLGQLTPQHLPHLVLLCFGADVDISVFFKSGVINSSIDCEC